MFGKFGSLLSLRGHSIGRDGIPAQAAGKKKPSRRRTGSSSWMAECSEQLECRALLAGAGVDENVSQIVGSQIEPSIAVNPVNPLNMAVVATGGDLDPTKLFVAYTLNGGQDWNISSLDSTADQIVGIAQSRFDGTVVFDSFGNLHLSYIAKQVSISNVIYGVSTNGGASFSTRLIEGDSIFIDTPKIAVGPSSALDSNQTVVITYTDENGDLAATAAVVNGLGSVASFSPKSIFYLNSGFGFNSGGFANPAVGPDGTIAITWQDPDFGSSSTDVFFARDLDGLAGGLNFNNSRTVLVSNAGATDPIPATPFAGSYASPKLVYDLSNRVNQGRLYLIYEDKSTIFANSNTDVYIRISNNNGATFGAPIKINDDAGSASQFYANLSVDPITGALFAGWYDTRNDLGNNTGSDTDLSANTDVEVWGSFSTDGGQTWAPNAKISDGASNRTRDTSLGNDYGRYLGVANYAGIGYMAWADNSTSQAFDIFFDSFQYNLPPIVTFTPDITLAPVFVNEDENTGALTFIVSDDLTPSGNLTVTGSSSNQSLVADSGILFGTSGSNRTVTVTPLANRSGKVTISVTVTDDAGLSTTKSFELNILPQPDPLPAPAGITLTTSPSFTDETATPLADNAVTTSSPITVSGLAPYLYDADVTININHPSNSQLTVVLISPQGTRVTLTSGNGGSLADIFAGSTFDDQIVSAPVTDYDFQGGVAAAYLVPEGALAQLRGENPNGDWTLEITDTGSGDTGTLNSWSLSLTTIPAAPQVQVFSSISDPLIPVAIPDDGTPVLLPLVFNGLDPFTWDVNVNVNIAQANSGDLDISLISPSGTEILLTSGNGGPNDDVFKNAIFDDQAANGTPVTDAAFNNLTSVGLVIPEAALSGFLGENPNGTWHLKVVDHTTNTEVGSVISWGLDISTVFLNDPPTVGAIINPGAIQEDSGEVTINLNSISAGGGETQPLKVTATSSDPALLPDPVVTYTSPLNSATLTYQPAPNAFGVVVVSVRIEDGGFDQNLATTGDNAFTIKTFTVVINPVNDAPTIDPVFVSNVPSNPVDEDFGTLDVQLTGISAGGDENQKLQLTAISSQPIVVGNPIIEYVQGSSTATMHIKSNPDFNGVVQFTVRVMDGGLDNDLLTLDDNLTTTRTFQLTVVPVNDPPTIDPIPDPAPINEDAPTQSLLLTNLGPGGSEVQPLSVTATSSDLSVISDTFVNYIPGNPTATLSIRPALNGYGTAAITVTVEDGGLDANLATKGDNLTKVVTFNVTVNQVNDPPVFGTLNDTLLLDEDAPQQVMNLTGVSAGPLEDQPVAFTVKSSNEALIPTPTIDYTSPNSTGTLTFNVTPGMSGASTITVTLTDAGLDGDLSTTEDNQIFTRTLVVIVRPVNDLPTIDDIPNPASVPEDSTFREIQLTGITAGDGESQPIKIEAFSNLTSVIPSPVVSYTSGTPTGTLTFTPAANQFGTVTISVRVTDGGLDGDLSTTQDNGITTKTFDVTISPLNDAPSFDQIPDTTPVDQSQTPAAQTIVISGVSAGPNESQQLVFSVVNGSPATITDPVITYIQGASTATLKFTPKPGEFGIVPVTVTVTDPGNDNDPLTTADNRSYSQTFNVVINEFNAAPTLDDIPDPQPIDEDSAPQTIQISNVSTGAVNESSQPLRITAVSSNTSLVTEIVPHVNAQGIPDSLIYTLGANQSGTAVITVTLTDGGLDDQLATEGDNKSITKQFTVTVNPVNDAPSLQIVDSNLEVLSDHYDIDEDAGEQTLSLQNVSAGAFENQPLKITATVAGQGLTLITAPVLTYTSPNSIGSLTFGTLANKSGTAVINIKVEDGGADGNLSTPDDNLFTTYDLSVNIADVNDDPTLDPIANPDTINEDATTQFLSLTGITAGGNEQQSLSITAVSNNPNLIANPSVVYTDGETTAELLFTPTANRFGVAQITVTVDDQHGGITQQVFTVTVNPINDPPTIDSLGQPLTIDEDSAEQTVDLTGISAGLGEPGQLIKVTVTSNRTDITGDPVLTYTPQSPVGQIKFQPLPDANGTAVLTVKVMDGGADNNLDTLADNLTTTVTLTVNITPTPEFPSVTIDEGTAISNKGRPVSIAPNAAIDDPDSNNFKNGGILVQLIDGAQPDDRLILKKSGKGSDRIFATKSGLLKRGGDVIGSITGGTVDTPLIISFSASVSRKETQTILRNVQFKGHSKSLGLRRVQIIVTDNTGLQAAPVERDIALN